MNGYISFYVAYMLLYVASLHPCMLVFILVCLITCTSLVGLVTSIVHLCLITCVYACAWLVTHCLCMLMFAYGQVYSDVMVVFMHEVIVCVVDKVIH